MDLVSNEPLIRLTAFVGVLALLFVVQARWPARGDGRWSRRQAINLGLVAFNTLTLRLFFPVLAVAFAIIVHDQGGGLFGWLDWPLWLAIPVAVMIFDLAIYWQHRLMHTIPCCGDCTGCTIAIPVSMSPPACVFIHLEIVLSMGIKLALIWLLGPHPLAVLIFELLLATGALFTHADFALPKKLDRRLRWLIVTPSMHRIHHSTWQPETDSNYGFHLSIWDRLFHSYTTEPRNNEREMPIGLNEFRDNDDQGLVALLLNPFRTRRSD
jgi:sterol desaturase/sphingolipid hydroxylase (fatty acid hydroxylase superfamily)